MPKRCRRAGGPTARATFPPRALRTGSAGVYTFLGSRTVATHRALAPTAIETLLQFASFTARRSLMRQDASAPGSERFRLLILTDCG